MKGRLGTGLLGALSIALLCARGAASQDHFPPVDRDIYRVVNSVAFSPSGDEIFFAVLYHDYLESLGRPVGSAPETALFSVRRAGDGWATPEILSFSGVYQDYEPTLSADGRLMVFNSKRPDSAGEVPEKNDLWMVTRDDADDWSDPIPIPSISTDAQEESYGSLTADSVLVYLQGVATGDGGEAHDLYWSRFQDGAFLPPEPHPVSTAEWGEGDPWVASDGSYLIYTRWDPEGDWAETVDLYIAFSREGEWSEPVPLEHLNTPGADFGAAVTPDGRWLHYKTGSRFQRVDMQSVLERYSPFSDTPDARSPA